MPKHKIPRKSTHIDMTAMCDVAFLLLTFFMLTTKFKPEEPVQVDTPTSVAESMIPDANVVVLSVDKDGKVFYDILGRAPRSTVITAMQGKYKLQMTQEQSRQYQIGASIGCAMKDLPALMSKKAEDRKGQPGIPCDSTNNELLDWVTASLYVNQNIPFVIKADKDTEYPKYKKVVDILQKAKINKFSLITGMEKNPRLKIAK